MNEDKTTNPSSPYDVSDAHDAEDAEKSNVSSTVPDTQQFYISNDLDATTTEDREDNIYDEGNEMSSGKTKESSNYTHFDFRRFKLSFKNLFRFGRTQPDWTFISPEDAMDRIDHVKGTDDECDLRQHDLSKIDFGYRSLRNVQLQHSKLIGADLSGCFQVTPGQIGGSDLTFAFLPDSLEKALSERLEYLRELNKKIGTMEIVLVVGLFAMWIVAYSNNDVSLFNNSGSVVLPLVNLTIPPLGFLITAPILIIGLYLWVQFHLMLYWKTLANLPAIFPDGTPISRKGTAWLGASQVENDFPVLWGRNVSIQLIGAEILTTTMYAASPIVIAIAGWRCLPLHSVSLALWYILLVSVCLILCNSFAREAARSFDSLHKRKFSWLTGKLRWVVLIICPLLLLVVAHNNIYGWGNQTKEWSMGNIQPATFENQDVSKVKDGWVEPDAMDALQNLPAMKNAPAQPTKKWIQDCAAKAKESQLPVLLNVLPANLDGTDLNGLLGRLCNLTSAHLNMAKINNAVLSGAKMQNTQMYNTELIDVDATFANFQYAYMSKSLISGNLSGAKFQCIDAENTHFNGSKMIGADFQFSTIENSFFDGATISNTNFSHSILTSTSMVNVNNGISSPDELAKISKNSNILPLIHPNLFPAPMTTSDVSSYIEDKNVTDEGPSDFSGAILDGVKFNNAVLIGSLFVGTSLKEVDLDNADIRYAQMYGADLSKVKNFNNAKLEGVLYDSFTQWPAPEFVHDSPKHISRNTCYFYASSKVPDDVKIWYSQAGYPVPENAKMLIHKIDYSREDLSYISLKGHNLSNTLFFHANLSHCDLDATDFSGTVLVDSDLSDATNLSTSTMNGTIFSLGTKWPHSPELGSPYSLDVSKENLTNYKVVELSPDEKQAVLRKVGQHADDFRKIVMVTDVTTKN